MRVVLQGSSRIAVRFFRWEKADNTFHDDSRAGCVSFKGPYLPEFRDGVHVVLDASCRC